MDDFPQAALSLVQDDDPVVRKIAEKALQAIAEHKFRRGRATPKGDRIRRLAPVLELMRANNATFEQMLDLCRSEGLDVTAETVRTVLGWRRKDRDEKSGLLSKQNDKTGRNQLHGSVSELSARIRTKPDDNSSTNSGTQKAADLEDAKKTSTTGAKRQAVTQAKSKDNSGLTRSSKRGKTVESTANSVIKLNTKSDGSQGATLDNGQTVDKKDDSTARLDGDFSNDLTPSTESSPSTRVAPADKKKFGLDRITAR